MAGTIVADVLQNGAGTSTSMDNAIYGSAKAWVRFAGSGSSATVNASYNTSSVTRNASGSYTVNITNALTDANACALATTNGPGYNLGVIDVTSTSSTQIGLTISGVSGATNASLDATIVSVAVFR